MDRRKAYLAGVIAGACMQVQHFVFDIDFGPFIWAGAVMTVGFAIAYIVTPAEAAPPAE